MPKKPIIGRRSTLSSAVLLAWRERLGYSQRDACKVLGCSRAAWSDWESGAHKIPRYIGLACAAIALGLSAYGDERTEYGGKPLDDS